VEKPGRRVVSVADLHGDFEGMVEHLKALGLVAADVPSNPKEYHEYPVAIPDELQLWSGGTTVFVQLGDVVDKGSYGLLMYRFLWRLQDQAKAAGGEVVLLLGNHELFLLTGDPRHFAYTTVADMCAYAGPGEDVCGKRIFTSTRFLSCKMFELMEWGKKCPFGPMHQAWGLGGAMRKEVIARMQVAHQIGAQVFVHAGLVSTLWPKLGFKAGDTPTLKALNEVAMEFLQSHEGEPKSPSRAAAVFAGDAENGPLWTRLCEFIKQENAEVVEQEGYFKVKAVANHEIALRGWFEFEKWAEKMSPAEAAAVRANDGPCDDLRATFSGLGTGAQRLVVGHCPQTRGRRGLANDVGRGEDGAESNGVTSACGGILALTDTYMSKAYTMDRAMSRRNQAALEMYEHDAGAGVFERNSGRDQCRRLEDPKPPQAAMV